MPKGQKARKKNPVVKDARGLVLRDDSTQYGIVTKIVGGGRFKVKVSDDNKEVIGRLCGKFRKGSAKHENKVEINTVVLLAYRDYQTGQESCDIIHVYKHEEVRQLRKLGEFVEEVPENAPEQVFEDFQDDVDFNDI